MDIVDILIPSKKDLIVKYFSKKRDIYFIKSVSRETANTIGFLISKVINKKIELLSFSNFKEFSTWKFKIKKNKKNVEQKQLILNLGGKVNLSEVVKSLTDFGYQNVSRVWQPGEYMLLGDTLILCEINTGDTYRIEIYENVIERISLISIDTYVLIKNFDKIFINSPQGHDKDWDFYKENIIYIYNEELEEKVFIVNIEDREEKDFYLTDNEDQLFETALDLGLRSVPFYVNNQSNNSKNNMGLILKEYVRTGVKVYTQINSNSDTSLVTKKLNLRDIVEVENSNNIRGYYDILDKGLFFSDYESKGEINIEENKAVSKVKNPFTTISFGDYIVHEDHGLGVYSNIERKDENLYLVIRYAGLDKLYVPFSQINKISKYIGLKGKKPVLANLNGRKWKTIKKKVQESLQELARELLQLYALREIQKFNVNNNTNIETNVHKFINSFKYEDTIDQKIATNEILKSMRSGQIMDRLLVGDVGFGKTEVALRGVFLAVQMGYQVAILAPTTILVEQHLSVARERFSGFIENPDKEIESISRFKSEKEKKEILNRLEEGSIKIIIGTHSLLSKAVKYKNLGLLIIDEEQKFGVKQKEAIKSARVDTHVLSMSATPIPRTLSMSLTGIRDISVISSAPLNRKEIINNFSVFNWDKIFKAIENEIEREGQVYFLHNQISDIEKVALIIQEKFPDKIVDIAHGRMSVMHLASTMRKMVEGKIDILVCTTIIENGIDLPNVNTLIIDDPTKLGLSQMYQIRGRVGRSEKQGYAYFFYKRLKGKTYLRLEALEESQSLGSGFILANKDLEIRGAGNLLGKEQSGLIYSVGYSLYMKMLAESINKYKKQAISTWNNVNGS